MNLVLNTDDLCTENAELCVKTGKSIMKTGLARGLELDGLVVPADSDLQVSFADLSSAGMFYCSAHNPDSVQGAVSAAAARLEVSFALKMMNSAFKLMDFVSQMMNSRGFGVRACD